MSILNRISIDSRRFANAEFETGFMEALNYSDIDSGPKTNPNVFIGSFELSQLVLLVGREIETASAAA